MYQKSIRFFPFLIRSLLINIRENVTKQLHDPLLLGSSTILATSKIFCYEITSQIHDQIFIHFYSKKIVFVYLKKIDHHLVG
jgi:hypothetical protein